MDDVLHLVGRLVIESLGGTVPLVTIGSTQERAQKRTERRLYFEELKSLVGPWKNTQRVYELKVLERGMRLSSLVISVG